MRAILALSLCLLAFSSCSLRTSWGGTRYVGSGVRDVETRSLGEITAIDVSGSLDIEARVGEEPSIVISGDDNMLEHVITDQHGDTLKVRLGNGSYDFDEPLRVTVYLRSLSDLTLRGSGDATISGLSEQRLELSISGSGDVHAEGQVIDLEASIRGSGDMDLEGLSAETASVSVMGSGDVSVRATRSVDAVVKGSGDIEVYGGAEVNGRTLGSGDISVH